MKIDFKKMPAGEGEGAVQPTLQVTAILSPEHTTEFGSKNLEYAELSDEERAVVDSFIELVKVKTSPVVEAPVVEETSAETEEKSEGEAKPEATEE